MAIGTDGSQAVRRYLPKTLFGRSVIIIVLPLILVQMVSTWVFYDHHWNTVMGRLAGGVAGDISMLLDVGQDFEDPATLSQLQGLARHLRLGIGYRTGEVLAAGPSDGGIPVAGLAAALHKQVGRPFRIYRSSEKNFFNVDIEVENGVVGISVPRKRLYSSTTYVFVMWMVGSSMLLFGVATLFMRNQVRPISRLAQAVDSFGKGRDVREIRPEGAAEIRLAAQAFERMRLRIQNAVAQRTEMLAGVSHDLRSPLTRMKLQLEMLESSDAVEELKADVQEMETTVGEFLAFVGGEGREDVVMADLGEMIQSVARIAPPSRLRTEVMGDLRIPVRPNAVRRCLTNLVSNALMHAGQVRIVGRRTPNRVELIVDDNGPGIPQQEREAVFKPFYRLDSARSPDTGGTGLGLSIARDIARGHGGEVNLYESPLGGLRAVVELPL